MANDFATDSSGHNKMGVLLWMVVAITSSVGLVASYFEHKSKRTHDKACKLRNEIVHLDMRIALAAADRQYLETHGSLPLPRPPAPASARAASPS